MRLVVIPGFFCKKRFLIRSAVLFVLCIALAFLYPNVFDSQTTISLALVGKTVVVDAGHGGIDPGVVGVYGSSEKEINLAIAKDLENLLQQAGANVVMTRDTDAALENGKRNDLNGRIRLVEDNKAAIFISMHCNSFKQIPSTRGAQVFYSATNEEGRLLALAIQDRLNEFMINSKKRVALKHQNSFLLKNIKIPSVIVEVGFLSNAEEEALLNEPNYQWEMAWAIYEGLLDYLTLEEQPDITEGNPVNETDTNETDMN